MAGIGVTSDSQPSSRLGRLLIPALLLLGAAALYLPRLHDAPLYVSHDEIVYSLQAHALASTGRDLSGRFLPLYIEYPAQFGRPTWDQPILIYAIAATLKVLPFSEFAIRLPMAILAILDVLLTYVVAKVLFESERFAIGAAILLALTPAHFMHGRVAIDFQLSLPFILAWLLCLALYFRRGNPRLLFVAGVVLCVSLFGYVAAYVLVPILVAGTSLALYRRRDPATRHMWLVAGIAIPGFVSLPWMLRYPLPFRDVVAHYAVLSGSASSRAGFVDLVRDFVTSSRLVEIPSLYASFWDPEFLFINGPLRFRATQLVGVFLVALAGALSVGLVHAVRRRSSDDLLLLVGFLTGPLVASLGGEGQTVWRTLQIAPFGILLAVSGLRQVSAADATRAGRAAVVVIFAVGIALASWYHDFLPHAQALVRASTVPLAVAGLALLLQPVARDRVHMRRIVLVSVFVLMAMHAAYFVADHATAAGAVLVGAISLAIVLVRTPDRLGRRPLLNVALLALAAGQFMYLYVDYGQVQRVGVVPASVLVLALRLVFASGALAAVIVVSRLVGAMAANRPSGWRLVALSSAWLVATQIAYYGIDAFTDFRLRGFQAAVVVTAVIGLAVLVRGSAGQRVNVGQIAIAGLFGLASLQFATFYADYLTDFQARGSADIEGNVRGAFESVIERTRDRSVPTIYLGRIGPYAYGELFWKFYLVKHHREDLLTRTIADGEFKPDRVHALPPGSLVITSPTRQIDSAIDELTAAGALKERQLLKAPDGAPIYWILETATPLKLFRCRSRASARERPTPPRPRSNDRQQSRWSTQ